MPKFYTCEENLQCLHLTYITIRDHKDLYEYVIFRILISLALPLCCSNGRVKMIPDVYSYNGIVTTLSVEATVLSSPLTVRKSLTEFFCTS